MSAEDRAFLDCLASTCDAAEQMDYSDDGWKPPVGKYDVALEEVKTGTKVKDNVTNAWMKPTFRIISEGEFNGRTFSDFMYFTPQPTEITPAIRQLLRLGTCVAGRELKNSIEASQVISGAIGEFLNLEIFESTAKKGKNAGKVYTNIRFLSKLESTATAS